MLLIVAPLEVLVHLGNDIITIDQFLYTNVAIALEILSF